jgi:predicted dehydrogenase
MRAEVNVGVVGLGGPGHLHAFSVLQSGIGRLAAVCDLSDLRRESFEADFREWTEHEPPVVSKLKDIGERKLGEVYFTEATWIRSRGTPVGIDGWFTDRTRAGGGALIDIGVHAIDTGWFLMGNTATEIGGCPDVSEVSPTGSFAGARCRG